MGSTLSRNIRDLFEIAGCDGISHLDASARDEQDGESTSKMETGVQPTPRPSTPVPHHRTRLLSQDPRSPSVGIVPTPFANKSSEANKLENSGDKAQRNYLETDLDSPYDPRESDVCTPVRGSSKEGHLLPGLSASHLLKLKFLGMNPRSPSEGIARTPIQVPGSAEGSPDSKIVSSRTCDTSSICSTRSLFDCSDEDFDMSKACTEPSAVLSDYEVSKNWDISLGFSDHEQEQETVNRVHEDSSSVHKEEVDEGISKVNDDSASSVLSCSGQDLTANPQKEIAPVKAKMQAAAPLSKAAAGLVIFREDSSKTPHNTPKKKSSRTPLTPICNLTPGDMKGKKTQGRRADKEKLVCKLLSGSENTPTKQSTSLVKKGKKSFVDENSKLVEWDQDTTIII